MAVKNGSVILLKVGTAVFSGLTDNSFNYTVDTIDVTTKDSAGHKEYLAGEDDGDVSASALYDPSFTYSLDDIFTAAKAKAAVTIVFGGTTAGDEIITCSAIITNVSWGAPKNGASTVNASFKKTGDATKSTVGA